MDSDDLWSLLLIFAPLSLVSLGGGSSIVAPMEQAVVHTQHWLTATEFLNLFAISRAAPGPGTMLAPLIGWKVAGWMGMAVASLALFVPSSLLCYAVFRTSNAHRGRRWHRIMREALEPVGTGLILAGAITIFRWRVAVRSAAASLLSRWECCWYSQKCRLPVLLIVGASMSVAAGFIAQIP